MTDPKLNVALPFWAESFLTEYQMRRFVSDREKIMLAIELSRLNIEYDTGGPFGAAIFSHKDGKLLAIGVNLVTKINSSLAHAEVVAIACGQKTLNTYDLSRYSGGFELASSTEPCLMCMGAILWSGLRRVLCGANAADAEQIGFDEGPKPENWENEFRKRGVLVEPNLCRQRAVDVLQSYKDKGAEIYNPVRDGYLENEK